jgi:hypothetical protein
VDEGERGKGAQEEECRDGRCEGLVRALDRAKGVSPGLIISSSNGTSKQADDRSGG